MSAEYNLERIYELEDIIAEFRALEDQLSDMELGGLKSAGSQRWAGQKKKQFDQELEEAKGHFNHAKSQLSQAIADCHDRQYSLASGISWFKHPGLAAEAWGAIAESY